MVRQRLQIGHGPLTSTIGYALLATAGLATLAGSAYAFQTKGQRPAATAPKPAAPAAAAKPAPRPRVDTVAQQVVLQTAEWQEMMRHFDSWLTSQIFYDDETVALTRKRLAVGIDRMSAEQLKTFQGQMQEKLDLLESPLGQDAESYFMQKLAVASAAYIERIRANFPDILTATVAEINKRLVALASKRQSIQSKQQAFDESRQRRVASNQEKIQARDQARQRAVERRGRSPAVTESSPQNDFTPARDYFPDQQNNGGFGFPMLGFGFGGGIMW